MWVDKRKVNTKGPAFRSFSNQIDGTLNVRPIAIRVILFVRFEFYSTSKKRIIGIATGLATRTSYVAVAMETTRQLRGRIPYIAVVVVPIMA